MKDRYELVSYGNGRETSRYKAKSRADAARKYNGVYAQTKIAPRLFLNGEPVPIYLADKLMRLQGPEVAKQHKNQA